MLSNSALVFRWRWGHRRQSGRRCDAVCYGLGDSLRFSGVAVGTGFVAPFVCLGSGARTRSVRLDLDEFVDIRVVPGHVSCLVYIGERLDVTGAVPYEAGPIQSILVPGPPTKVTDRHRGLGRLGCRHRLDGDHCRHTVDRTAHRTVPGFRGHHAIHPRALVAMRRRFSMSPVCCNHRRARFSAARLTPVFERANSIARADTQPAASKQLPASKCDKSHALARSSGVRVPPRLDRAIISPRLINDPPMVFVQGWVHVSLHSRPARMATPFSAPPFE